MRNTGGLLAIETHPVQYRAPIYRALQQTFHVPVTTIYGSDFSVAGYRDAEFGSTFSWDTDLLDGYRSVFLTRTENGAPRNGPPALNMMKAITEANPSAILLIG